MTERNLSVAYDMPIRIFSVLNSGFTGVLLSDGAMGIAMNIRSGTSANARVQRLLAEQVGKDALGVSERLIHEQMAAESTKKHLLRSVIIAIYNALFKPFVKDEYLRRLCYRCIYRNENAPAEQIAEGETISLLDLVEW